MSQLEEVVLTVDELEALRLSDLEGLYQEAAADQMNVSRQTFGRIVSVARKKVAEALVVGKAVRIEGGEFQAAREREFECQSCRHVWKMPQGTGRPAGCPECGGSDFQRINKPGRWTPRSKGKDRVRRYPPRT